MRDVLLQGKAEAAARYARRNLLVMLTLTIMIVVLSGYVLQTMTFADPWHVITYRWHAHEKGCAASLCTPPRARLAGYRPAAERGWLAGYFPAVGELHPPTPPPPTPPVPGIPS